MVGTAWGLHAKHTVPSRVENLGPGANVIKNHGK